ncbi:hypothetical protein PoB_007509700 [Plakobranchus ocellatus]|uniref:Uncharacterized protein n=1 Tax=Plakobranchus ocellatus TaxID=259542 RepID=A0AAV4DX41_9GAST|nr:hypothetical protein PoB_007509700 [Plakobranchus ocellatus]
MSKQRHDWRKKKVVAGGPVVNELQQNGFEPATNAVPTKSNSLRSHRSRRAVIPEPGAIENCDLNCDGGTRTTEHRKDSFLTAAAVSTAHPWVKDWLD